VGGAPGWLSQLPTDGRFLAGAAVLVIVTVLLRLLLQAGPRGRALRAFVHALEGSVLALLLAVMIFLSFLQVVLRNLFDTGLLWIEPLLRHLLLWVGVVGAAFASRSGRHINVDALSRLLPATGMRLARVATNLFAATVTLFLAHACFKLAHEEMQSPSAAFLSVAVWQVQLVMPLAMLLMSSRFLGHGIEAIQGRGLHPETPGEVPV